MKMESTNPVISRRGSKLLVELVIGVIGLLGILLAQAKEPNFAEALQKLQSRGQVMSLEMTQEPAELNLLDLLF